MQHPPNHHERGQLLIEFGFSIAIVFLAMFGVMDFGRALYAYDLVTSAARTGTRYAIVHGDACSLASCPATAASIQTYVQSTLVGIDAPATVSVATVWSTGTGCVDATFKGPQCTVKVTVSYSFPFLLLIKPNLTIKSSSQMVIVQ